MWRELVGTCFMMVVFLYCSEGQNVSETVLWDFT
jgi:hypothetical protein